MTRIRGRIYMATASAKLHAAGIERVDRHRVAKDVDVAIARRKALGERFPLVAAGLAAINAELALGNEVFAVALDRRDVDRFRLVGVHINHEAEIGGEIATDFVPAVAGVVAAHDVPMLLHEERVWLGWMHGDVVNAVADFGVGIGNELGNQALVDRLPGFARIVGAERARGGNRDVDAIRIFLVENDGVETHAAGAGLPLGAGAVSAQGGMLAPILAAVRGLEKSRVFHARVDDVWIEM